MTRRSYEIRADGVHFASERDRIAALEAQQNQQLREALLNLRENDFACFTSECWDAHNEKPTGSKFEHIGKCLKARAALAATEEK